jgi:hypothetical protein
MRMKEYNQFDLYGERGRGGGGGGIIITVQRKDNDLLHTKLTKLHKGGPKVRTTLFVRRSTVSLCHYMV